jgi:type VI secretion system protein ImpG
MDNKYYQQELESLRDTAAEFALAYPAIAPQLGGPRPDPDVERVLEGVAFLTGQIRGTLEEGFPEFAQGILNQILPHYLRPIPSATIIKFTPKNLLKGKVSSLKGTYIDSKSVEGVSCRFRTCFDVDVVPLILEKVTNDSGAGGKKTISLNFELQSLSLNEWKQDSIRFYLDGDYSGASDLYYLLMRNLEKVEVCGDGNGLSYTLPRDSVRPVGYVGSESLLQYPTNSFPAYQLVQEYFLLKEKFLFLDITGLHDWNERGSSKKFSITFTLSNLLIPLPKIGTDRFVLNATPAVNLFTSDAEPMLLDNRRNEIRIKPVRESGGKIRVYSVDSVTGRAKGAAKKTEYISLNNSFGANGGEPVYQVTFRTGQDELVEPYMMVSYPDGYIPPEQETLAIQLTCTNGPLASTLRPGDISTPTANTSELVEFSNIIPPTEYQTPPTNGAMLWKMLSHLSLNYLPVANANNLRALLELYVFSGGDKKAEIANKRRIAGLLDIEVKLADRLVKGVLMRGQEIHITVDKDHFSSHGDLFVFGTVLDGLFASYSSLNVYTVLIIKDANSREHYEWPARLGQKPLI